VGGKANPGLVSDSINTGLATDYHLLMRQNSKGLSQQRHMRGRRVKRQPEKIHSRRTMQKLPLYPPTSPLHGSCIVQRLFKMQVTKSCVCESFCGGVSVRKSLQPCWRQNCVHREKFPILKKYRDICSKFVRNEKQ